MANTATIDPKAGPVSWSLSITHLKLGIYEGVVYDNSKSATENWEAQRTDDSLPDRFQMKTAPANLIGGALWWQCVVSDPNNEGGPFVCVVAVEQKGQVLCQDAVAGTIDPGSGQIQFIGDQIKFQ